MGKYWNFKTLPLTQLSQTTSDPPVKKELEKEDLQSYKIFPLAQGKMG